MAVRRSQNWINQQRVDTPHLRSIESAIRNDFDELLRSFVLGEDKTYVLRGFEIAMDGAVGASANSLQLVVEEGSIFHATSDVSGTFFVVPSGTNNESLSSTTNTKVEGSFTANALNYVGIEFVRQVDDATTSQVFLWNPTSKNEITKTLPLAETLDYKIVVSSSTFAPNVLPISVVQTDSSNNVQTVEDRRPLLFRLGTAGSATPNPFHAYGWDNHVEGRTENFWSSSSSSSSPFRGGDKQILTLKEWMDSVMSSLKEVKGTTYWYSPNIGGSLVKARQDLANTIVTGRGSITHNAATPGLMNWSDDIFLTTVGSRLRFKIEANATGNDIVLSDNEVAYIDLVRDVLIIPNLIFTQGSAIVSSVGAVNWTADVLAGDYVRVAAEDFTKYYKIDTVDSLTQVTLTEVFLETSTGAAGTQAMYAWGTYQTDPAPSTNRHVKTASKENVPFNEDTYWLLVRQDNEDSTPNVYARFLGESLELGESQSINNDYPDAVRAYLGMLNDADGTPDYENAAGNFQVTTIKSVPADDLVDGQYFLINSANDANEYYVWFNKDGGGSDPAPALKTPIEVAVTSGDSDVTVSIATAAAIALANASSDFTVPVPISEICTVTNQAPGPATDASNVNVGGSFEVSTLTQGFENTLNGQQNYFTKEGENVTSRVSKLTSMMADKAQDKTIELLSDHTVVNNTGSASETLEISQTLDNLQSNFTPTIDMGQSFTVGASALNLSKITVKLFKKADVTGNAHIDIYAVDGSGFPTGGILGTSDLVNTSTIPNEPFTNATEIDFTFSTPVALSSSTQYAFVLSRNGFTGTAIFARYQFNTDEYVGGTAMEKTAFWANLNGDLYFKIFDAGEVSQNITFSGGTGIATVAMPSSNDNGTINVSAGTLSLGENQVAYYQVDRNAPFSLADLTELTVVDIDSAPLDENVFIFAYRLSDSTVYLWNNEVLLEGSSIALSVLRGHVQQNKTVKLIKGGVWSWDLATDTLTNSLTAHLQVAGLDNTANDVAAQSIVLDADGKCAYVTLKRTAGASTLTVNVADIALVPSDDDTFIIARRTNNEVIVGTSSFALKDKEFLELDGALSEINRYFGQLRIIPHPATPERVVVTGADIAKLNGSSISQAVKNLLLNFDGAEIDFITGEIFADDGSTPLGIDFVPSIPSGTNYKWYSVTLSPSTVNADNTINGQLIVLPASAEGGSPTTAIKPAFPKGTQLGLVYTQGDGGGSINAISYANIQQLGVGGGGAGGEGDANDDLVRYRDRLALAPFNYANINIGAIDEEDQIDGASTATFDIPSATFKFLDSTAQVLLSTQQLDADFLLEGVDLSTIELYTIWSLDDIDTSATYEISRDGGSNFQTITMERVGNSDTFRGLHSFTDEPSNAFSQEHAVANADALKDFDDASVQEISQKFTVAATTVYKNIINYINKNQASSTGNFCVEIVADDSGAPSTDPNDVIWTSPRQNIDDLSVGNNVVDISSQFVLVAGDYHIIIRPDSAYRTAYTADNNDKISLRTDATSGPTPNIRTYNGTAWSSEVAGETAVYRLEGRVLDVRIKITSSATADDKLLSSYGLFYNYEDGIQFSSPVFRELFKFDGTIDNDNEFVLTNFLPDSRLLMCFATGTGQVFRYGDFVLDGHKVIFPPNTFNVVGDVELEFFQNQAVAGPASTVADSLLAANNLGSTDASIDKSANGRGIILRNQNGDLIEIGLDASNNFTFTVL